MKFLTQILAKAGIIAPHFQADTVNPSTGAVGRFVWNDVDGTMNLGLKGGNVTLELGQQQVARVVNKTNSNLLASNYQAVRISGAQGQRLAVDFAQANNDLNSADTIGLVTENISNNQEGFVTTFGRIEEINTTGSLYGETWADGDVLYLSGTTPGAITNVKPSAPIHIVVLGYVEYAHQNHGKIFVKIMNGWELYELHDVAPTPYINKGVLYRDTATNLWKSATIETLLGQAGSSSSGYLSSTDWNTFNNKFDLPSLTNGSVLFSNGTTIAEDNANFFWNDSTNRLGIGLNGTTAPRATLHVGHWQADTDGGTQTVRIGTQLGAANTVVDGLHLDSSPSTLSYNQGLSLSFGVKSTIYGEYTSRIIHYGHNTSTRGSRLHIQTHNISPNIWNNGIVINENGLVGINTTAPNFGLDVSGTTRISSTVTLSSLAGTGSRMVVADSSGVLSSQAIPSGASIGATISGGTTGSVLFVGASSALAQDNANFFWDDTNNRLGIGTATPANTLDVNGTVRISSTTTINAQGFVNYAPPNATDNVFTIKNTRTGAGTGFEPACLALDNSATALSNTCDIRLGSSNPAGIRIYASSSVLTTTPSGAGLQFYTNSSGLPGQVYFDSGAHNSAALVFRTAITSGTITERMRVFSNGNVGINVNGTDSGFRLDVNGTARVSGIFTLGATSGIGMTIQNNTAIRGTAATGGNIYIDANSVIDNTGTINLRGLVTTSSSLSVGTTVSCSTLLLPNNGSVRGSAASNGTIFIDASTALTGNIYMRGTNFGIENTGAFPTTHASALVTISSTTKGFLLPRMTAAQRTAISTPASGLVVYQTDATEGLYQYKSSGWEAIGGGGSTNSGPASALFNYYNFT